MDRYLHVTIDIKRCYIYIEELGCTWPGASSRKDRADSWWLGRRDTRYKETTQCKGDSSQWAIYSLL